MPLTRLDHVLIAVRDLDAAARDYETLIGRPASLRSHHPDHGTANALFYLDNTYIELISPRSDGPFADKLRAHLDSHGDGLLGLALGTDDADALAAEWQKAGLKATAPQAGRGDTPDGRTRHWRNVYVPEEATLGLLMFAIEHVSCAAAGPEAGPDAAAGLVGSPATLHAVDHVVINTPDGNQAIALLRDAMGIRLALDRDAPQWGARMLFFRLGGITLEVIQRYGEGTAPAPPADAPARYWGIAFRAVDVAAAQARLAAAGVDVSQVRTGRKPGTVVATVRDTSCGVPTLIIGPAPEEAA